MKKDFAIHITFLIAVNVLIKPFYIFGIDMTVQNRIGTEMYGLYLNLFNFAFLWQIINDFGIQNFNNRTIAQHPYLAEKYIPPMLLTKLLLGFVYALVVAVSGWLSGYGDFFWPLLSLIVVNHFLSSLVLYFRSNLSGLGWYTADSIVSVLDRTILIAVVGFLLWGIATPFELPWFIYAQTFSLGLTVLVAAFLLRKKQYFSFQRAWRPALIKTLLRQSLPYALVVFLMTVYTRIDTYMLFQWLEDGDREVGIYGAGFRFLDACNMIGFLFATLLLPMFSKLLQQKADTQALAMMGLRTVWTGAIAAALFAFAFSDEIMPLLIYEADQYYGAVMGVLMLSFVAMSGTYIFGTLLTANGNLYKMNWIFVISILANVVLNAWLIPDYKAYGTAWATLVTQLFAFLAQVFLCHRLLKVGINKQTIGSIAGYTIGLCVVVFLLQQWEFSLLEKFIAFGGASLILAFISKMLQLGEALALLKSKVS